MNETSINTDASGGNFGVVGAHFVRVENLYVGTAASAERIKLTGPVPACPYPGLAYFGPQDALRFFGRDQAIEALVAAVAKRSFTALVGASGSGKSSVLLAGLWPRLVVQNSWRSTYFRIGMEPDKNPFVALARALAPLTGELSLSQTLEEVQRLGDKFGSRTVTLTNILGECRARNPGKRILLIADQFEEIFTLVPDEALRNRFIDTLLEAFIDPGPGTIPDVCLVLTLRADFYSAALRYRPLADRLQNHVENLGPMTRDELREAIVKPAEGLEISVTFEPGLVGTILDDVEKRPGSLPLLQFALREMWGRLKTPLMTRAGYDDIGGVEGALAKRAQAIFDDATNKETDVESVALFRRLFTRLVMLGEGAEDTRRIAASKELGRQEWALAQKLAGEDNRLVLTTATSPGQETVEVAHEALIRNWPALVNWVNHDREFIAWRNQFRQRLDDWQRSPLDEGTLLRGGPLAVAEDWIVRRGEDLNEEERSFVGASTEFQRRAELEKEASQLAEKNRNREREQEQARALRDAQSLAAANRRTTRRTRAGLAVAVILAVAAAVFGLYARNQKAVADKQTREANNQRDDAKTQRDVAQSARRKQELALTAALEAESRTLARQARESVDHGQIAFGLRAALDALPRSASAPERPLIHEATTALDYGILSAEQFRTLSIGNSAIVDMTVSPDEKWILAATADGSTFIVSVEASNFGNNIVRLPKSVIASATDAKARILATASFDNEVQIWTRNDWTSPRASFDLGARPTWLGVDPTGGWIAVGGADGSVSLLSSKDRKSATKIGLHAETVTAGRFDPSGQILVTAAQDGSVRIWDIESSQLVQQIAVSDSPIWDIAIDRTGQTMATASADGVLRLWNLRSGTLIRELGRQHGEIVRVLFAENSEFLISANKDGDAIVWDPVNGTIMSVLKGAQGSIEFDHAGPSGDLTGSCFFRWNNPGL